MKTARLTTATRPAITSTVGALSDRELLRETSNLVRHERHLQGAIIDHLAEIEARGLHLQRGFSSLFDYAVRELGYSDAAAARRIGAMRLCADQPHAREGLRDGSLTLSAAAELQWAFARQRRRGSISGTAAVAPAAAGSAAAGSAAQNDPAADSAAAVPSSAEPEPPLVLDAAGRRQLVDEAAGKSARQVRQMLADVDPELAPPADRVRPLGDGRYELKATIDAECQQGLEQLRGLLSHVDPRMTLGQLVGRLVKEGLDRHDPSRPPRRARSGSRPADAKAHAPRTPPPEQAQGRSVPAAKHAARPAHTAAAPKTDPDAGHHATPTPESQAAVQRRAASTTKDAAIPAGAAPTPARAVRPTPTSTPPPSTQKETARRAATGAKPTSAATPASKSCASGHAISAAVRRQVWQRDGGRLHPRRSTDRAPLRLNASDRGRPHRPHALGGGAPILETSDFWVARPSPPPSRAGAGHRVSPHRDPCLPKGAPRPVSPTRNPEDPGNLAQALATGNSYAALLMWRGSRRSAWISAANSSMRASNSSIVPDRSSAAISSRMPACRTRCAAGFSSPSA